MTHRWKRFTAAALAAAFLLVPAAQAAEAITPQQLKELLQEYYIRDIPQAAMEAETVEDIISALGDPYTVYMTAEEFAEFESSMSDGTLVGIGISGVITEEGLLLTGTYAGSPAEKLGLQAGDLIFRVEGGPDDQAPEDISGLLRGEEGTEVTFLVRHEDGREETYTTNRAKVIIPATSTELLEDGTTAYISCTTFGSDTLGHFVEGTQSYDDVNVWIVDLRKNGGGDVYAAAQSVGVFLGKGTMAYLRSGGDTLYRYVSEQDRTTLYPAIVLVGPSTASSAEIYSQAMKDKTSGMIIGSNTFGKGVAQVVLTGEQLPDVLVDGEAIRITAYQSYGVNGNTPQDVGVIPDLLVDPGSAYEIARLFSSREPVGDHTGWARIHLGGWRWYLDLSQAKDSDKGAYFSEMLSAVPPGCKIFLGTESGWEETDLDTIAQVSGAADYHPRRFLDTEGKDCQFAADTLYTYGILQGMAEDLFIPDGSLTRAQLCALLVQAMNLPDASGLKDFDDVSPESWYSPYIKSAQAAGYVEGMSDTVFSPETPVTHEQLMTILGRMSAELNLTFRNSARNLPEEFNVPDNYSDWAQPWAWLLALSQQNILGQPLSMLYAPLEEIDPQAPATRGETAQILYTILNAIELIPY